MTFLSLVPQIHLWLATGRDWNGTYATVQGDEFLYSAYVNALRHGRPRRNDPFAGRDSTAGSPLPESSFSIQFIPAYVLSFVSRGLRVSASTVFVLLTAATGFATTWSIFFLIASVWKDERFALTGAVVVLCLGELAGDGGIAGVLLLNHKLSVLMPFLRRYQPAFPLPLLFLFCTLVWRALSRQHANQNKAARLYALLGGLVLVVLIFSYLYAWTAAVAWLLCALTLWLGLRLDQDKWDGLLLFAIPASLMLIALVPYAYLISNRSHSLDDAQILVITRRLDLFHLPEILGIAILLLMTILARVRRIRFDDPRVAFTASFAILPIILFNQQVITGRSMQPFHFDLFIANYVIAIALISFIALIWKKFPNRALVWIAALAFASGLFEVGLLAKARSPQDVSDDRIVPVLRRLDELASLDGTVSSLRTNGTSAPIVFSPHVDVMRMLPTWTSQGTLLGAGGQDFGTATRSERQQLLYQQLYFSGVDAPRFRDLLNQRSDDAYMNFFAPSVIFGDERFIPALSISAQPISPNEIESRMSQYQQYIQSFSRINIGRPLTYVIARIDDPPSLLARVDQWYQRDTGEQVGEYVLYRVKLRD